MDIRRYLQINQRSTASAVNQTASVVSETVSASVAIENAVLNEHSNENENRGADENVSIHQKGLISEEDFELVPGKRQASRLLFLNKEKCLYMPVTKDKFGRRYKCYTSSCSARAVIRVDGVCEKAKRNFLHVQHKTHCELKGKLLATNRIKESCANVETLCAGSSQNVSVRDIFDKETMR